MSGTRSRHYTRCVREDIAVFTQIGLAAVRSAQPGSPGSQAAWRLEKSMVIVVVVIISIMTMIMIVIMIIMIIIISLITIIDIIVVIVIIVVIIIVSIFRYDVTRRHPNERPDDLHQCRYRRPSNPRSRPDGSVYPEVSGHPVKCYGFCRWRLLAPPCSSVSAPRVFFATGIHAPWTHSAAVSAPACPVLSGFRYTLIHCCPHTFMSDTL